MAASRSRCAVYIRKHSWLRKLHLKRGTAHGLEAYLQLGLEGGQIRLEPPLRLLGFGGKLLLVPNGHLRV